MAFPNLRLKQLFDQYQSGQQAQEPMFPQPVQRAPAPIPDMNLEPITNNIPEEIFLHELDPQATTDDPYESGKRFGQSFTPPPMIPPQEKSIWDRMKSEYTPEVEASARFKKLLDETPERQSPGIARRIAAAGAALKGGPEAADKFMFAPHMRAMEDWKAKTGPFGQAAQLERQTNVNERQLVGNMATADINQRKVEDAATKNRESAEIARKKNEIAEYISKHPKAQVLDKGPYLQIFDPATKQVITTTVPTGSMTQLEVENARTARATSVASIYAGARGATERPADVEKKVQNVLREQYSRNSKYRKFIEDNGDGTYALSNPADWWSPSQQDLSDYSELLNMVFGGETGGPGNVSRVPAGPQRGDIGPDITGDTSNMSVIPPTGTGRAGPVTGQREYKKGDRVTQGEPIQPQQEQAPIIQYSPSTKSHRGSLDGGKTWMYSVDGGKTWTTTPPPKKVQ